MSILDNVRMGRPDAAKDEVLAALKAAQCMDIIEKLPQGVYTVIGTQGVYLSGGEAQRIAIARVMLKTRRSSSSMRQRPLLTPTMRPGCRPRWRSSPGVRPSS